MQTFSQMRTKEQILKAHRQEVDEERTRAIMQERAVSAIPEGIMLTKAYTTLQQARNGRASAHGVYEFNVMSYTELDPWLMALKPAETVRVVMQREGKGRTMTFYPAARVPQKWWDEHEVTYVEPFLWQGTPRRETIGASVNVSIEWYVEPRTGLFILCRAKIENHKALLDWNGKDGHYMEGVPSGQTRRFGMPHQRPSVTVYWYMGSFVEENTFAHHLAGGPTQNV